MGQVKYAKLQSRELALTATTGASSGVANTLPQIFFKGRSSLLNSFREAARDADETVEGDDCYVLTGNALGMTVRLWIIKTNFLIKQKQQVLGGHLKIPEMSEAKMEEGYKMLGGNSADERKARIEKMRSVASKLKGTMTETYENIKTNQPLTAADFKHEVPAGTMLSDSLF